MKNLRSAFLFILVLAACGRATAADPEPRQPLTPGQIEELVSPIALYPDPLVALILPAATRPSDIVLAARFLERGGDPERVTTESWDESVKALARYREVLAYLDENLAWTRSLGECFLDQPDAVMDAIQMVRVRARATGLLRDSSEQEIIVESDEIRIVPANPTIIYVPRYDPEILYVSSFPFSYAGPFLTFGVGYSVGAWLSYDCDWRHRHLRIAHRPAHWYRQPDWRGRNSHHPAGVTTWNRWVPPPRHGRRFDRPSRSSELVLRPNRPRGLPGPTYQVAPSTRQRDAGRSGAGQSSFHPEPPRGREGENQDRNNRMGPRRDPAATRDAPGASQTPAGPTVAHRPPVFERPSARVSPQRAHNGFAANPRQDHGNQPSVRPAQVHPPSTPAVIAPPPERPQPTVETRPAEPRGEGRDRSPHRQRPETNEPRRPLN